MPAYTRNMNQLATYWPKTGTDVFGLPTFGAPVELLCRWQDRADLVRTPDGREVVSSSVIYPAQPLLVGGWLALGNHVAADPRAVAEASEIISVGSSPDLASTTVLYKAWL
jgi:hypothetical protein